MMRAFPAVFPAVLIFAGAVAYALRGGGGGTDPAEPPPPVNTAFAGVLLRLDLGADTLAAAGVSGQEADTLVAAVEQGYSAGTLASRDEAFIAAKQTHDRLRRLVQSGKGRQEDVSALRAAETALADATSARDTYLAGLRNAGLATLPSIKADLVRKVQANRKWSIPPQYLVLDRTERQWVELRSALAAKRISEQDESEEFPASAQSYLAAADAVAEVAAAKVNLDSNLAAVQTAWNTAATD